MNARDRLIEILAFHIGRTLIDNDALMELNAALSEFRNEDGQG